MADTTPSLAEIGSFDKDANLVAGRPAQVLDISSGLKGVWDAAHEKAQYDWMKYQNHQKQVGDWAAGHQLDYAGVRNVDIPLIQKMAGEYFQEIAKDPRKVTQIGNDPKWNEIQAQIGKSKGLNSYADTQMKFLEQNPHLLTDENKKRIAAFQNGSIDQKPSDLQIDMPKTMDLGKMTSFFTDPKHGFVVATKGSEVPLFESGKPTGLIKVTQDGKSLNLDGIKDATRALYKSNSIQDPKSPYGTKDIADDMFSRADDKIKKDYKERYGDNAAEEFFVNSVTSGISGKEFEGGKTTLEKDVDFERRAKFTDDLSKMKQKFKYDYALKLLEGNQKKDFELWKENEGLTRDRGGKWLNDFTATFVTDAITNGRVVTYKSKDGTETKYAEAPASEQMKKVFGKETVSEGKKTVEYPDQILVSTDGTHILPIYHGGKGESGFQEVDESKGVNPIAIDDAKALFAEKFKLTSSLEASNHNLLEEGLKQPSLNNGSVFDYIKNRSIKDYAKENTGKSKESLRGGKQGDNSQLMGQIPTDEQIENNNLPQKGGKKTIKGF